MQRRGDRQDLAAGSPLIADRRSQMTHLLAHTTCTTPSTFPAHHAQLVPLPSLSTSPQSPPPFTQPSKFRVSQHRDRHAATYHVRRPSSLRAPSLRTRRTHTPHPTSRRRRTSGPRRRQVR
jgi:hypothetical protein